MITADQVIDQMEILFPDQIASHEHNPIVFEYQIKLARWMQEQQTEPDPKPDSAEVPVE
jgi:hypothetical protein